MLSVAEALNAILRHTPSLGSESVSLEDAVDRVLARDILAREDLPSFDNSAMDGYAVKISDLAQAAKDSPVPLKMKDIVRAGSAGRLKLSRGEAIKVMTGAPVPEGTEAVVMREHTREPKGNGNSSVFILRKVLKGENIRPKGEDVKAGSVLLKKGCLLRPYDIALLAAQGISAAQVVRRPRVAVAATGDELVDCSVKKLSRGKIRNSNTPAACATLKRWGALPVSFDVTPDDPKALKEVFASALKSSDILLVSGGVSVGDFDYTKTALEAIGLKTIFWKVAMKPGKPLLFGLMGRCLVFGVPGNPVSTLVSLEELVRPAIEKMQGRAMGHPSWHLWGVVDDDQRIRDTGRRHYLFSRASQAGEGFSLRVIHPQGSAMVGMASTANALAIVEPGIPLVKKGEKLPFRWIK